MAFDIESLDGADDLIPGRRVTLKFNGDLIFTNGNNLKLARDFVTSVNDTITLVCNGTDWFEVSRSVN